jgi:putative transferase (TIGR04331 family)
LKNQKMDIYKCPKSETQKNFPFKNLQFSSTCVGNFLPHLPFKILAAEWRECGTKLLYHQHGGGYGIDKVHAFEDYETRVSDYYFTWGWSSPNHRKVGPLSHSMLHVPKEK